MTAVRIEALDPKDPRAVAAVTAFLNEMVVRVDANALITDPDDDAEGYVENGFFLVAIDDHERVVGCGALQEVEPGVGQIRRMWVNPVLRGRSIGRRLLSALEGAAAVAGFELVRLEAYEGLTEAILLYETSGYQRVDAESGAPADMRFYEKRMLI